MENSDIWELGLWRQVLITQYFESAKQAGLVRACFSRAGCEDDLFNVPVAMLMKLANQDSLPRWKVRKGNDSGGQDKASSKEQKQMKQGRTFGHVVGRLRKPIVAPKAVDEDLYKIPPELLCQKAKENYRKCYSVLPGYL